MEKIKTSNFEKIKNRTAEAFENAKISPISSFSPENGEEAKVEFLENPNLEKPNNFYKNLNFDKISEIDDKIFEAEKTLEDDENLGKIESKIYKDELKIKQKMADLLRSVTIIKSENFSQEEKSQAEFNFMKNNIELYGEPDKVTFESLMKDKMELFYEKNFGEDGVKILSELENLLEKDYRKAENSERFKPSDETFSHFGKMVEFLYKDQLAFVPEKPKNGDKFQIEEVFEIFDNIFADLRDSGLNPDAKAEWTDKKAFSGGAYGVKVPRNRSLGNEISPNQLRGLIVHEMGTHFMRAEIGKSYNVTPLSKGLSGYLDTEEGIARAMEMAVSGEYQEAGVPHYITAGLAYFEGKNFRQTFETNWRIYALEKSKNGEITDEKILKAKDLAFRNTQRIFRGTDELPWFKDLSYFNGSQKIWRYIEENIDSPTLFDELLLAGKSDLFNKGQERSIYELRVGKN